MSTAGTAESGHKVAGMPKVSGKFDGPRACRPLELAPTLDAINLVFRWMRVPPGRPTMGWDYTHIYNPDNLPNVRVVFYDGRPVSFVGIYPTWVRTPRGTIGVGGINAVGTLPDYRRQGLSSITMEDAHAKMHADGLHIGLLGTGIPDFYRKLGWELAGQQWRFSIDRGNVTLLPEPSDFEVTEQWRSHAPALCALHNAEAMGMPRDEATFVLLAERKLPRILVAQRHGEVVAYVGFRGTSVVEYGGEPSVSAALIGAAYRAVDDPTIRTSERAPGQTTRVELTVVTPAVAGALPGLLQGMGLPYTLGYQGMIKVLDAVGLFDALGIRDVDLEAQAGGWRLHHRGQELEVTEQGLVKLLFGPERFTGFASHVFPVPFYQWPAERV